MLALTSLLEPAARARAFSNQPELRRTLILSELEAARVAAVQRVEPDEGMRSGLDRACELGVATADLIDLLRTGHAHWCLDSDSDKDFASDETERKDGLVPYFFTRTRPARGDDLYHRLAWHATDRATPLYSDTASTLEADAAVVCHAAARAAAEETLSMYVLTTMPGHHAASDHYGGYCFVNWAALLARLLEDAGRRPVRSPKLTVGFSQSSYILIKYRVVGAVRGRCGLSRWGRDGADSRAVENGLAALR